MFLGTSVVSGTGTALALATGPKTMFGDIAARLRTRAPETEFEHGLRRFSLLILRTTVVLVLFILMVGIALKHDAFESLLFAVALGVGLTPEFLPMISSVTLTQGALRMARDQVIVKHLPAIQNFGSIDILCSDKTGTLTAGVDAVRSGRRSAGAAVAAAVDAGLHQQPVRDRDPQSARCRDSAAGRRSTSPAIRRSTKSRSISSGAVSRSSWRRPMATGRRLLITKGAPEPILALSTAFEAGGQVAPLDAATTQACAAVHERLSADGLRVLAVAYRWLEPRHAYSRDDEADLVLAGFVSFADPVLPDVAEVLAELKRDGVTVKILTGDNELVARHVCREHRTGRPADRHRRRHRADRRRGARPSGGAGVGVRARLAGAEEPDHSRAEAPRPRRRVHGRRHQRRAVAAHRGCRHFGDDGRRRRARRRRCHSRSSPACASCIAGFSKAAGPPAT